MAQPQLVGTGHLVDARDEVLGQPVAGGKAHELRAVEAHGALARSQPEVALPVLRQGVDKRLVQPVGGPKLPLKNLLGPQGQCQEHQTDQQTQAP